MAKWHDASSRRQRSGAPASASNLSRTEASIAASSFCVHPNSNELVAGLSAEDDAILYFTGEGWFRMPVA
jgi:hypothetical protein